MGGPSKVLITGGNTTSPLHLSVFIAELAKLLGRCGRAARQGDHESDESTDEEQRGEESREHDSDVGGSIKIEDNVFLKSLAGSAEEGKGQLREVGKDLRASVSAFYLLRRCRAPLDYVKRRCRAVL